MLAQGEALVSGTVTDKDCASALTAAEAAARQAKRGTWADPAAIKNAESPGDILAGIGRFTVVEGKVLSVRQAGATTYLNFGRNWTRDFAVTISRRVLAAFEAAGIVPKSLENRRIRVRGWVEARGGPRIEVLRVGQIEVAGRELARGTRYEWQRWHSVRDGAKRTSRRLWAAPALLCAAFALAGCGDMGRFQTASPRHAGEPAKPTRTVVADPGRRARA